MFLMIKIIIAISAVILLIYSHVAYAYKGYPQSMYWRIRLVGLGIFTGAWGMWSLLGYDTTTSSILQSLLLGGLFAGLLIHYSVQKRLKMFIPDNKRDEH
jgi:hypothetical protein